MEFNSIAEAFYANDRVRSDLKDLVASISDEQATQLADNERWNIAQIVEHISIVDEGASKICARLLANSDRTAPKTSGKLVVSDNFLKHYSSINEVKLEAPERVQPTGNVSIADSLIRMDENRRRLRELQPKFESTVNTATFPHPYFGEMSAVEWLILIGGHEARHTEQIRRILEKLK
jgi:hypothetical protein